jgi:hypothetical protein
MTHQAAVTQGVVAKLLPTVDATATELARHA